MTNFDMTIDEEKGSRKVKLLYSRIVYELNQIDPRMKFRVTDDEGTFKADFTLPDGVETYRISRSLQSVIKVKSSRLSVMYRPRWIKEPWSAGAKSFFAEIRRTHPRDLNELYPMHISPNTYWHQNTYNTGNALDDSIVSEILEWGASIGIPPQNSPFGILEFSPEAVVKIADRVQKTLEMS
jgi:hypothetical protein